MNKVLENYGVKLVLLTHDKIEMVRRWRNDPKISQYMEYRDEITKDMQERWFDSINNDRNLYYIIVYHDEEIGLINIKDIDNNKYDGESGVFIYEDKFLNSDIAYRAHLCLFDYYFINMDYRKLHAHVIPSNKRASRLTIFIGYKQVSETEFVLCREDYLCNKNRLRFINKYNKLREKND